MKRIVLAIICSVILIGCADETTTNLTEKYGLSEEVLKSSEFKDYVSVMEIGLVNNMKARDEFVKTVESNPENIKKLDNSLGEIEAEMKKADISLENASEKFKENVGAVPFDHSMNNIIKEKRNIFFNKFPEFENNAKEMDKIKSYMEGEILNKNEYVKNRELSINQ